MFEPVYTTRFEKDLKKSLKRGKASNEEKTLKKSKELLSLFWLVRLYLLDAMTIG